MDTANIRNMTRIAGGSDSQQKIFKMLSFADYGDKSPALQQRAMLQIHGIQVILMRPLMM